MDDESIYVSLSLTSNPKQAETDDDSRTVFIFFMCAHRDNP